MRARGCFAPATALGARLGASARARRASSARAVRRAEREKDDDSRAARSFEDERVDGWLARARMVLGDSRCRLALPTERAGGVQERPFSDCCFGFAYCAATFAALGVADGVIKAALGPATPFMIGAWGSLGVLAFGTMDAPPLRLWNVVVATTASASVSIFVVRALGATWLARALSLSLSLAVMMRMGAIHPPAGAVALAAMDSHFHSLGWLYALYPTLVGSAFILCMSRLCHATKRRFEFEFIDVVRFVTVVVISARATLARHPSARDDDDAGASRPSGRDAFHDVDVYARDATTRARKVRAAPGKESSILLSTDVRLASPRADERDDTVNMYLEFHYANTLEHFAGGSGVREEALGFAERVARGALGFAEDAAANGDGSRREMRALDVGCAVGGSAFHLATKFDEVVGFDYSTAFVKTCRLMQRLRDGESLRAETRGEGDERVFIDCYRPCSYERAQRVKFHQGDACEMARYAEVWGTFDCVILANLLCRLPRPRACLDGLRAVVRPGGRVFIFTPWSWLDEYTPDVNERITAATLEREMNERGFELVNTWEEPCFIREHRRKAQYIVSQGWCFTRPEHDSPR